MTTLVAGEILQSRRVASMQVGHSSNSRGFTLPNVAARAAAILAGLLHEIRKRRSLRLGRLARNYGIAVLAHRSTGAPDSILATIRVQPLRGFRTHSVELSGGAIAGFAFGSRNDARARVVREGDHVYRVSHQNSSMTNTNATATESPTRVP